LSRHLALDENVTIQPAAYALIDSDVHLSYRKQETILPYLPEPWKSQVARGLRQFGVGGGYGNPFGLFREDTIPPKGGTPGSDPEFMREQLMRPYNIEKALITPVGILSVSCLPDTDFACAVCSAYNDWLIDSDWLHSDTPYYGAMIVATQDPEQAAREIERVGNHPRIASVLLTSAASIPYGKRYHWPLYAAAEREGLPIALHVGAEGSGTAGPPTAIGWPSTYFEFHTSLSQGFMAHTVSLVAEGVFQKFPSLKFVLMEGGFGWLPHLMWRMDKNYKGLRQLVPWLTEMPSAVIRRHIRLTTQPIEEPENPKHLLNLLDMMDSDEMLLFSSDYPHWDFDDPLVALRHIPEGSLRRRILRENALETFPRIAV
jgi:uncharacterized protein